MKIAKLKLKNFKGYETETIVDFSDLTAFVGKNDIGKSTILEALDIFFNDSSACVKLDKTDINIHSAERGDKTISITVCFKDLPSKIIIDSTNYTTLKQEYLLNENNELEITKKYPDAGKAKVYIRALHPSNSMCSNLILKKANDLRNIINDLNIKCENNSINAIMRKTIWNYYNDNLQLKNTEIEISSQGDAKAIWECLQIYLPLYSLFQADRRNCDNDSEVQDPLKEALKEILSDANLQEELINIELEVKKKLEEVSLRTLAKLKDISPVEAQKLSPAIPNVKWNEAFKNVSICGDNNIPINKRGSGVKRLILLSFFMAEAEKRMGEGNFSDVIYAIEEPETSQHTENQNKLVNAFLELAKSANVQIVLTTHSANIVKKLDFSDLRIIRNVYGKPHIENIEPNNLPYPSLNEINFIAFDELNEEYHNELYGYIEGKGLLNEYEKGKDTIPYKRLFKGEIKQNDIILSTKIRHQIHHPENILNPRFSQNDLKESIS